mgnify:CR=1 FL=1
MTLHLSKEEFNKEIKRLHNRINLLTKHVAKQNEEIENLKTLHEEEIQDLKIKHRLEKAKNEIIEDIERETYLETKN